MDCTILNRDRRRNMTTMPSGRENRSVRKKIRHVRSIPSPIAASMVERLIYKLLQHNANIMQKTGAACSGPLFP
jgi:hypothetical protein